MDAATRAVRRHARLQVSAQVIEMFAASIPYSDGYMEVTGRRGIVEFWRDPKSGFWRVPADLWE